VTNYKNVFLYITQNYAIMSEALSDRMKEQLGKVEPGTHQEIQLQKAISALQSIMKQ
jgi:hypothetical protein